MKYKILKIRQKLSFLAFQESKTITEFFARKIHEQYIFLTSRGEIKSLCSSDLIYE